MDWSFNIDLFSVEGAALMLIFITIVCIGLFFLDKYMKNK